MSLPQVTAPEFTEELPSTGEKISYRPFLVKEEKILYMALEGEDPKEIAKAITEVVQNCIMTPNVDVKKMVSFDMEYLFLKLRAKSVSEISKVGLKHSKGKCDHVTTVPINIEDVEPPKVPKRRNDKIMLTDKVGVKMKYPTLEDSSRVMSESGNALLQTFSAIAYCIDNVFDEKEVYEDFTHEEVVEWLQTLDKNQFGKLLNWFKKIPTLEHTVEWTCLKCKKTEKVKLRGMMSFFE